MGVLASIIDRSISGSFSSNASSIGSFAFYKCANLGSVSFPMTIAIDNEAFDGCKNLTSVSFPNVISIGDYAFNNCSSLTNVSFLKAAFIGSHAFYGCNNLETITVGTSQTGVCQLRTSAFGDCPKLANIYVPSSLVDSYKSATGWTEYADKIKAAP